MGCCAGNQLGADGRCLLVVHPAAATRQVCVLCVWGGGAGCGVGGEGVGLVVVVLRGGLLGDRGVCSAGCGARQAGTPGSSSLAGGCEGSGVRGRGRGGGGRRGAGPGLVGGGRVLGQGDGGGGS
jgi:hypothetical protein